MKAVLSRTFGILAALVFFVLPVSAAHARTLKVAGNGVDGPACGPRDPCRSISRAIANADDRDTIIVGPGFYGDISRNGVLGEAGEETGAPGCNCMLAVNKAVVLVSSDGAAVTVIDARTVDVLQNVLITAGAEFGRPGKGFTVTPTGRVGNYGIVIDGTDVQVRGNQALSPRYSSTFSGIFARGAGEVLIEGNQSTGWSSNGIVVIGSNKTVKKNVATQNFTGIRGEGVDNTIEGNFVTSNLKGLELFDLVTATGNAAYGNELGIQVYSTFAGTVEHNNLVGNRDCGLYNFGVPFLFARNNYWGTAMGPGLDPADNVCNAPGKTTFVTPFATRPFGVKSTIDP